MTRSGDPRVAVVLCGDAARVASALPVAGLLVSGRIRRMPSPRNIATYCRNGIEMARYVWHKLKPVRDVSHATCAALRRRRSGEVARAPNTHQFEPTHAWRCATAPSHLVTATSHCAAGNQPRAMLSSADSRFPIPAMRAAPHILSPVPRVIGCRHSVKECRRVSSLYFRSPPQLPQELHEHRTACRNRPGHGRPG